MKKKTVTLVCMIRRGSDGHTIGLGCGKKFQWSGKPADLPREIQPTLDEAAWRKRGVKRVLFFHTRTAHDSDPCRGASSFTCGRVTPEVKP